MQRRDVLFSVAAVSLSGLSAVGQAAGPGLYRSGVPMRVLVEEAERDIIEQALKHHGGQMAAAARALDLERSHLYKKARALGLRGDGSLGSLY